MKYQFRTNIEEKGPQSASDRNGARQRLPVRNEICPKCYLTPLTPIGLNPTEFLARTKNSPTFEEGRKCTWVHNVLWDVSELKRFWINITTEPHPQGDIPRSNRRNIKLSPLSARLLAELFQSLLLQRFFTPQSFYRILREVSLPA